MTAQTKLLGIRIHRDLHRRARVRAAEEERPLSELVREALQRYLASKDGKAKRGAA